VLPLSGELALRPALNKGRASLASRADTPIRTSGTPVLVAADPELAPIVGRLSPGSLGTDPWIFRDTSALDARVESFVRAGSPPVYVGFGSMVAKPSYDLGQCVVRAARLAGRRVIVAGGWASIDKGLSESDDVLAVAEAPHGKLLPLVAAAVHHGGAGTTTAAFRAGIPQVIVPHVLDQFYWARRVELLGIGPRALPVGTLDEAWRAVSPPPGRRAFPIGRRLLVCGPPAVTVSAAVEYLERCDVRR
jgi:vancomycin aglycone glucosyltransferase